MRKPSGKAPAMPAAQLRAAVVRRHDLRGGVAGGKHLPTLGAEVPPRIECVALAGLLHPGRRRQQPIGERSDLAREVLPVVVVRYPNRIERVVQVAVLTRAVVRQVGQPAIAPGHSVVGQAVELDAASIAALEIAELGQQRGATPRQDGGRDGRVAVGRNVPVVRHSHFQTALGVQVDRRRQPARLAVVGERKAHHRKAEDRHAEETQHRPFGDAFVGLEVDAHTVGREQPVGIARAIARAAGVGGVHRRRARRVDELEALRSTARAGAPQRELRLQKEALEALQLQLQFRAPVVVAVAADAHVAFGVGTVLRAVVGDSIGTDHRAGAAELHLAFGHRIEVGPRLQTIGPHHDRTRARSVSARRRRQLPARHQAQRCVDAVVGA